ncbi:MAG: hypothetical protein M1816_005347 [Peltula sp. TS41687]|nr:MAG: hypothetical protein M1816_005347 [Peltula sp. TS41687]
MTTHIPLLTLPERLLANPALAVLFPIAIGAGLGYSTSPKKTQRDYMALKQPPFRPPPWVFGPVWTALYGMMGYASYRAWTTGTSSFSPSTVALAKQGATLYTIQLGLNQLFMPLFFSYGRPLAACIDIVALTGVVAYLIKVWSQVDRVAGWLLAPYLAWLCFATYLSVSIGFLNNWDFSDKEVHQPPSTKSVGTKYVNEKPERKKGL